MSVGAPMECPRFRRSAHDDLHTRVRCVVLPRTLLTVHVSKTVGIFFDKVVVGHDLGEVHLPKRLGGFEDN